MGAEQSNLAGSSQVQRAFHVLRVDEDSPASAAKLLPYFDYIIAVNGVEVVQEIPNVVAEMAKNHIDIPMTMIVYNSRVDATRKVTIIPSRSWGGKTLLGASIRYCQVTNVIDRVWHVIDVNLDSPAFKAGLIPQKDWIIGSSDISLNSSDDFYNLMIHNQKRPVKLLVYNLDQDLVRETSVTPDFDWGGEGCLGCDVASGALHRIPPPITSAQTGIPLQISKPETIAESFNYQSATLESTTLAGQPVDNNVAFQPFIQSDLLPPTTTISNNSPQLSGGGGGIMEPIPGFGPSDPSSQELSFLQ